MDHSHPQPLAGQNVLSVVNPNAGGRRAALLRVREKQRCSRARAKRIRPHLDDKILASWNGLMLGAFARAGAVLGEDKYCAAAEKNLQFIREKIWVAAEKRAHDAVSPLARRRARQRAIARRLCLSAVRRD